MKKSEKQAIIQKAKDLGFEIVSYATLKYDLPLGLGNRLDFDQSDLELGIVSKGHAYVPIRKIESPKDLENLFNAICPEKYRLPFS